MTAPAATPARDPNEAMAALERLYAKKVVTLEEAQAAAKLITGDANAVFPPPPKPPEAAAPTPVPDAAPAQPADTSSNGSGAG